MSKLRVLRVKRGIGKMQMAKMLGISTIVYCYYERHIGRIKLMTFINIANILGIELEELYDKD